MKKRVQFKHFVIVLFLLQGVASAQKLRMESSVQAMGSAFSVVLYDHDRNKMEAAAHAALAEALRLDDLLSNYKPASEWSRMNREAANSPVKVSEELFGLLVSCLNYSRASEGAFDITVGPLMKVWGFYDGTGALPKPGDVRNAMQQIGYRNIVLDANSRTVSFARKGINLDPGGIGKGYAVDRMVETLRNDGIETALVSAAGSSIYCLGTPPGEQGWHIHLKAAPVDLMLVNQSISTSGTSEKSFTAQGKVWSHIMDPRTGYPSQGTLSVSVIAPGTLDSEAWAKPYFINGREWTATHKPRDYRVFYCEQKADQQCAWLP